MTSHASDVHIPATETEIAAAVIVSDPDVADTIRRLAFQRDELLEEIERLRTKTPWRDAAAGASERLKSQYRDDWRDWLAGQALQAILSRGQPGDVLEMCHTCWGVADAMIATRNKSGGAA